MHSNRERYVARGSKSNGADASSANTSFQTKLWLAAGQRCSNTGVAQRKHVVLGLTLRQRRVARPTLNASNAT